MSERATSGLRIEIWDPVDGHYEGQEWLGPAVCLGPEPADGGPRPILAVDADGDVTDLREACGMALSYLIHPCA